MTGSLALGLLLALGSAAALNWGYFAQHGAAAALPPLRLRRPWRSLRALLSDRRWSAGLAAGLGGWALYVTALALAPLSLVQATSAGGVGLLALLVWRTSGARPRRRELVGVAAAVGGLVLLVVSLSGPRSGHGHGAAPAVAGWLAASAAAAVLAAVAGSRLLRAGAGLGVAAGVLYAAGDVATKAATGGALWFAPAVLACHGLAFVALQLAFQRGGALATAGVATLWTNALPIVAGATLFHETPPAGALGAARLVAFAAVVVGAAAFAARDAGEDPGVGLRRRRRAAPERSARLRAPRGTSSRRRGRTASRRPARAPRSPPRGSAAAGTAGRAASRRRRRRPG